MENHEDKYLGTWVLGQYRIERVLKHGGMGTVYLATQVSMDRPAAVKILRAKTESRVNRFHREARAASRLIHPNIVTVYNFGELVDRSLFLAMEYVEGTGLVDIIGKETIPLLQAVQIARQCADALGHAHSKQVVHRDFKPSNVIITQLQGRDHVKVLDFGLARLVGETTTTQSGSLLGTPRYMTPEQWQCATVTTRTDQYTLGQVLWELVAGREMVDTPWPMECMNRHLNETPANPSELRSDAGIELLDPIVIRMLAKDPADRFEGMQDISQLLQQVAQRLEECHHGSGVRARIKSRPPLPDRGQSHVTSESMLAMQEHPLSVLFVGDQVLAEDDEEQLACQGVLIGRCGSPDELTDRGEPDIYVLGAHHTSWRDSCSVWYSAGIPPDKTLICIFAPELSPELADSVESLSNLLVCTHPPEPLVLAAALGWMRWSAPGGVELLWPGQPNLMRQLSSPSMKSVYVDDLLEDVDAEGVRKRTLRALTELGEEMITHAFYWAPAEKHGYTRSSQVFQQEQADGQISLHWVFSDRFIAVSVRDSFGALTPKAILSGITGTDDGHALSLRIMFQSAQHLFFAGRTGTWSEIMALVERDPPVGSTGGHTLCILNGLRHRERQIGRRLELDEKKDRDHFHVTLRGEINESCDFRSIFQRSGRVIIDMSEVRRINSMGIQCWIIASRTASKDLDVVLKGCSLAVVSQLNMVPEFARTGRVISICAPYYCTSCDVEAVELLQVDEIADKSPPTKHCAECNTALQFDDLPEVYFSFLD